MTTQITSETAAPPKTSLIQTIFRILLGMTLLYTGTAHLTFSREEFIAQVPQWVPLSGDFIVVSSGIVELILGAALIFLGRFRIPLGWIVAAFFVVIFPGNIAQFLNRSDGFGMNTDQARFIRLFFQPVLVAWALWSTGAWQAWWNNRKNNRS
jgi:uncharacterized membrane protein